MKLYHATAKKYLESIEKRGINKCCYLTNSYDQAAYYGSTVHDEGDEAVIIELELDDLLSSVNPDLLYADGESLSEPITSVIGMTEDQINEAWIVSNGTWQDSLDIVGSMKCDDRIPPHILRWEDFRPKTNGLSCW